MAVVGKREVRAAELGVAEVDARGKVGDVGGFVSGDEGVGDPDAAVERVDRATFAASLVSAHRRGV